MPEIVLPQYSKTPSPNYSSRNGNRVRLIVAHDCEGSYAGSVSWFAMTQSQVSAHIVLSEDGAKATQMVAFANKAWHACVFNGFSEGIEAAGFAAKGLGAPEWQAFANLVAFRLKANAIPLQRATAANDWTGWCQHVDLGQAGGGHHDVSSDRDVVANFEHMIGEAYALDMPQAWGGGIATAPPVAPAGFKPSNTVRDDLAPGSLEWAQAEMNKLHVTSPPLVVDGIEGDLTRSAISQFQQHAGLTVDGVLGPQTVAALKNAAG